MSSSVSSHDPARPGPIRIPRKASPLPSSSFLLPPSSFLLPPSSFFLLPPSSFLLPPSSFLLPPSSLLPPSPSLLPTPSPPPPPYQNTPAPLPSLPCKGLKSHRASSSSAAVVWHEKGSLPRMACTGRHGYRARMEYPCLYSDMSCALTHPPGRLRAGRFPLRSAAQRPRGGLLLLVP